MPFDWKQYLELARELLRQSEGRDADQRESLLRSVVSRAYYAAFCHARNYSRDWLNFQPNNTADDHGRLRAFLKTGKRRGVAVKLDQLRQWRNEADYSDSVTGDLPTMAHYSVSEADKMFEWLTPPTSSSKAEQQHG